MSNKSVDISNYTELDLYAAFLPFLRRYLKEKFSQCSSCGISEWNNRPITLEIEHIDGNWSNNKEDNLTLICPNCHSQTDTYRAKNKGKGRKRYGDMIAPSNIRSHSSVG